MERKYYKAYNDRYQQVHALDLQWFCDAPSPIVIETIQKHQITHKQKILELGCGEGRDAVPLFEAGFNLLATDVSEAAIKFCRNKNPQFADRFQILDCVAGETAQKFDFIFAVAVVHMLVEDADRDAFYTFIRNHLNTDGIALICTMGDGEMEHQTDIRTAFELQNRTHEQTGREVQIASTSCRMVSFQTFEKEIKRNGLTIVEKGSTAVVPDFPVMMYAVVEKN